MTRKTSKFIPNVKQDEAMIHAETECVPQKLNRAELAQRVCEVRRYIEEAAGRIAGFPFDVISYDVPPSVDYVSDVDGAHGLAELLNPRITGDFGRVYRQVCGEKLSNDELQDGVDGPLNAARFSLASTAFAIGVFAGRVFQGASKREIDAMERGLVCAITASPWSAVDKS